MDKESIDKMVQKNNDMLEKLEHKELTADIIKELLSIIIANQMLIMTRLSEMK